MFVVSEFWTVDTNIKVLLFRFSRKQPWELALPSQHYSHIELAHDTILCLIPRTTVTSLSAPKEIRYKTHPYASIPEFFFERMK